jgi:alkanesulfonate monooxygenase SsuD/methylene tetrahydromethanopterin reductase-like flavin-dependent oxidoreductase (luciferase family)
MTPNFTPPPLAQGHIPVMLPAVQEKMLQVAGEVCDGIFLHGTVTCQYIDQIALPNLRKGFAKSGRQESAWTNFQISGRGLICTAPDRDSLAQAVEKIKSTIDFYGSTRSYRSSFELGGWASCFEIPIRNERDQGTLREIIQDLHRE